MEIKEASQVRRDNLVRIILLPADGQPKLATYPFTKDWLSGTSDEPIVLQCRFCQAERSGYSARSVWIPSFRCSASCPAPVNPYSFLNFSSCGCGMEEREMVKGDMFYFNKWDKNGQLTDFTQEDLQQKLQEWEKVKVVLSQPHKHSQCIML